MRWVLQIALVASLLAAALPAPARAARLTPIGTFSSPMFVTAPPGDPSRLLVVEQGGAIRLVVDGALQPTPFLDLTSIVVSGGEQGLLSMAFAPDYAETGRFYVYFTAATPAGNLTIEEYRRAAANPNVADPATRRHVLGIPHPTETNHNGGQLQFGLDGLLYAATGDGGSGSDPPNNAQRLDTLLGKLIRIDPRAKGDAAYTVPIDNPFVTTAGARGEIYALGLRNPWRFSFDRETGDLWIGDVGQGAWEEIDHAPRDVARGRNFGWRCMEGPDSTGLCPSAPPPGYLGPVLWYPNPESGRAVIGGYVLRDANAPELRGRYLYADAYVDGVRSLSPADPHGTDAPTGLAAPTPSSFGEDACGRVYVASLSGAVHRIDGDAASNCTLPPPAGTPPLAPPPAPGGTPSLAPAPAPAADMTAPMLTVGGARRQRLRRARLLIRVRCDEPCTVTASARR
jgi:glucose/arabinose dehydrogenase